MRSTIDNPRQIGFQSIMLGLILLAAWLRLWQLNAIPPGMWYDEGYNALESIGILETGRFQIFFIGNNGREPLFFYLLALAFNLFGAKPFTLRIVSVIAGIISIPLLFRLVTCLFKREPYRYWLGVVAAAGLATSYWYLAINRIGLRAGLLVPFVILSAYLFCRGLHARHYGYFAGAGVVLGLSQYTYLAARLLPLVFVFFAIGWSIFLWQRDKTARVLFWRGVILMAVVSGLVVLPLGLFFSRNPGTFFNRVEDILPHSSPAMLTGPALVDHMLNSLYLFAGAGGIGWRYVLPTRPLFDWITLAGFWLGFFILVRDFRKSASLFVLSGLIVMWLPGFLSEDPVHELRQIGLLPFYYIVVAIGLVNTGQWLLKKWQPDAWPGLAGLAALLLVIVISGSLTIRDYFYDWANRPETYEARQGELFDTARLAAQLSESSIVALPFETYSYPSARLLLNEDFEEKIIDPTGLTGLLRQEEPVIMLGPLKAWPPANGLAWLARDRSGDGVIYISHLLPQLPFEETQAAQPVLNRSGDTIGYQQPLDDVALNSILAQVGTVRNVDVEFADLLRLAGYHLTPSVIKPGGFTALDLYWQGISTQELDGDVFIQLVKPDGSPVTQMHEAPFSSLVSRWHWNVLIPGRHLIWTGTDLADGPYLIQVGLFNPDTGRRFEVTTTDGQPIGDQMALGLIYVSSDGSDPRLPETSFQVELDNGISLLGYSFPRGAEESVLELNWSTATRLAKDYVTSVQLLDAENQIISQVKAQPLSGFYPTSRWQPGEIVVDQLFLPLDQDLLPGKYRLELRMYEVESGAFAAVLDESKNTPDKNVIVVEVAVP